MRLNGDRTVADPNWTEYVVAIGSIATPILVLTLTAVGWNYRQTIERKARLEENLRDDRIEIYNKILEPFILLFMTDAAWLSDKKNKGRNKDEMATSLLLSHDYRKVSFQLSLIGSDPVVLAFNDLFQYFFTRNQSPELDMTEVDTIAMLGLLGHFLLEIRRSMGNEATTLDNWGMLEWFITDARKHRANSA
jgi:hypothetical protein